jgi:uncharacterized membrane protein
VILDVASRFFGVGETASHAAWWLIGIGVLGALAAATVGLLDLFAIPSGSRAWSVALTHVTCNLAGTAVFAAAWFVRRPDVAPADGTSTGDLVLSLVALALVGIGGYLGGELAYRYGVRVADEATQATGFDRTTRATDSTVN